MKQICFPNYDNTPLNVMSSIGQYFHVDTGHTSNHRLDQILKKGYQTIVLMVFDGLGISLLQKHLSADSFLRKKMEEELCAVYPCTTTAAMTSYYTGLSPMQHGWLGWSLFFKEYGRLVDVFPNFDSITGLPLQQPNPAYQLMSYETLYQKIDRASYGKTKVYTLLPEEILFVSDPNIHVGVSSVSEICADIIALADHGEKKFIFAYWPEPDNTIHNTGTMSLQTNQLINRFNQQLEQLCTVLESRKDTLVLISADHGLTDLEESFFLDEHPELMDCLVLPPSMEPRCVSFFVKQDCRRKFEIEFERLLGRDFLLFSRKEVVWRKLFGEGTAHEKTLDFLGDYLACAVGNRLIFYRSPIHGKMRKFHAHHAGITWEEMAIPLIISR